MKKKRKERGRKGFAGRFGGCWAGPSRVGPVVALSLFFLFKTFSFLFSGLSYNFFILKPNDFKPKCKIF
jgi:hypothetical protein